MHASQLLQQCPRLRSFREFRTSIKTLQSPSYYPIYHKCIYMVLGIIFYFYFSNWASSLYIIFNPPLLPKLGTMRAFLKPNRLWIHDILPSSSFVSMRIKTVGPWGFTMLWRDWTAWVFPTSWQFQLNCFIDVTIWLLTSLCLWTFDIFHTGHTHQCSLFPR